jgi:hypothetical protein
MTAATHQPLYLPWAGFWGKALNASTMVLLDDVQFPLGRSWVSRNRIKTQTGCTWLSVPVFRKGKAYCSIKDVTIDNGRNWRVKHLETVRRAYVKSPYFEDYFPLLSEVYEREWNRIIDLDMELLNFVKMCLNADVKLVLSSSFHCEGRGVEFISNCLKTIGADAFVISSTGLKYLDLSKFSEHEIPLFSYHFRTPVYPQLWGAFKANLSTIDILFNCGPRARGIIERSGSLKPVNIAGSRK